ncbi:MAG: ribulose-phosphate 3-epimerase [Candidatus Nanopelagicus sp.]
MNKSAKVFINPSILNANFDDLENEISKVAPVSDFLHLDIMDNKFVPNFSFTFDRAVEIIKISKLPVDAHLMIENPDFLAPKYAHAGCASVTFHFEAAKSVGQIIKDIRSNGAKVGIAIKPGTDFSEVEDFIADIDMLVVMTVEPGFGGQSFMSQQMPKVRQAREWIDLLNGVKPILQVDGGISENTIEEAAESGANCFVAGSAVYNSNNPVATIEKLRELAKVRLN